MGLRSRLREAILKSVVTAGGGLADVSGRGPRRGVATFDVFDARANRETFDISGSTERARGSRILATTWKALALLIFRNRSLGLTPRGDVPADRLLRREENSGAGRLMAGRCSVEVRGMGGSA